MTKGKRRYLLALVTYSWWCIDGMLCRVCWATKNQRMGRR
jgi:hypothetical protein